MKTTNVKFLFLSLVLYGVTAHGQTVSVNLSTPHKTIQALFEAIRANDTIAYLKLLATPKEIESHSIESNKRNKYPQTQEQLNKSIAQWQENVNHAKTIKRFIDIRAQGASDGIDDWQKTKFKRATYKLRDNEYDLTQEDASVIFTFDDLKGRIQLAKVLIKVQRGWVVGSIGGYDDMRYRGMSSISGF